MSDDPLYERYGPAALVAGASEGIGAAFAGELARRGFDLLLVARSAERLGALAAAIEREQRVRALALPLDLAAGDLVEQIERAPQARGLDIGLLVYNAAYAPIGPLLERPLDEHLRALDVNCAAPLRLAHHYGGAMARRGRGALILMSSLSGFVGSPLLASYAATKAFNLALAGGLWAELAERGVDVLACAAGATRTPRYLASLPDDPPRVPELEPEAVAAAALEALGRGPICVPGAINKAASWLMRRLLPRQLAIRLMARSTRALYGERRS